VLPHLTPLVRAMVQEQRLSGMRPGEVVVMRPCDIDRGTGRAWVYRPGSRKTEHHDIARAVFLGPRAQAVPAPFLERDPGAYCFSPREALADLRARQRAARKSPVQPSQQDRRKRAPRKAPGDHYSVDTYGNAMDRACIKAGISAWHPPCPGARRRVDVAPRLPRRQEPRARPGGPEQLPPRNAVADTARPAEDG
jgi:integrase